MLTSVFCGLPELKENVSADGGGRGAGGGPDTHLPGWWGKSTWFRNSTREVRGSFQPHLVASGQSKGVSRVVLGVTMKKRLEEE